MKLFQIISILAISLFIAGCTGGGGLNAQALIEANTQVQTLLDEYPNASLDITYYSVNESSQLREEYNMMCNKNFTQKALYRFSINDETQNLNVAGYLNPSEQAVECFSREGVEKDSSQVEDDTSTNSKNISTNYTNSSNQSNDTQKELYYNIEADYEGIEPTQKQRELLKTLKALTSEFNKSFKLKLELKIKNGTVSSEEEGIVNSNEIMNNWGTLLDKIKSQALSSNLEEVEVKVEVVNKEFDVEENKKNLFKIQSDVETQKVDLEVLINKNSETSVAQITIGEENYERNFNHSNTEKIKIKVANEFDLDYNLVGQNMVVKYNDKEVNIRLIVDKDDMSSEAWIVVDDEEYKKSYDSANIEKIKLKISNQFDLDYNLVAQNMMVKYSSQEMYMKVLIDESTSSSEAIVVVDDDEYEISFNHSNIEKIKKEISEEFDLSYNVVDKNTRVEYTDQEIYIEILIDKNTLTSKADIMVGRELYTKKFNYTDAEEIKLEIAKDINMDYNTVDQNAIIEYNNQDVYISIAVDENTESSKARIVVGEEESQREYDNINIEKIKRKIAEEFDLSYELVAQSTVVEYYNKEVKMTITINENTETSIARIIIDEEEFKEEFSHGNTRKIVGIMAEEFDLNYNLVDRNTEINYEYEEEENTELDKMIVLEEGNLREIIFDDVEYSFKFVNSSEDELMLSVNGNYEALELNNNRNYQNISIVLTDLISSGRDSVNSYAELNIIGK